MNAILEINGLVKAAEAAASPSVQNGFLEILRRGDVTGSATSYLKNKDTGAISITPAIARRNIYRDAFKLVLGDKYSQGAADKVADEDYVQALKERYRRLKAKMFPHIPRFSKGENYAVATTDAVMPGDDRAYSYGSVNARVPISVLGRTDGDPLGETNWKGKHKAWIENIKLFDSPQTGKYTALHEEGHTVAPPSSYDALVKYIAPGSKTRKDLRYARIPAEMMVGVLGEKARKRAEGHGLEGIGGAWIDEMIEKIKKGWRPPAAPDGEMRRDWSLNIDSLRNIFYETYNKAHRKGASELDKHQYDLMIKELKSAFDQARNLAPRIPARRSWEMLGINKARA